MSFFSPISRLSFGRRRAVLTIFNLDEKVMFFKFENVLLTFFMTKTDIRR